MGMVIRVLTISKYVTRCMGASVDFQITIECRGAVDRGNSREVEFFPLREISAATSTTIRSIPPLTVSVWVARL